MSHITTTRHIKDKQRKTASSLLPINMFAKQDQKQSSVQQIMNQTQNPEKRQTINNESTTTKPPPA